MSKARREIRGAGKSFVPHAEKYEPPYGPKVRAGKIKGRVQGK